MGVKWRPGWRGARHGVAGAGTTDPAGDRAWGGTGWLAVQPVRATGGAVSRETVDPLARSAYNAAAPSGWAHGRQAKARLERCSARRRRRGHDTRFRTQ